MNFQTHSNIKNNGRINKMKDKRTSPRRNDLILAVVLLLIAAVSGGAYYFTHREPAILAEVTIDGRLVETLDLSKDQEVVINGARGGTNKLVIEDGEIWCAEASCPDSVCIHQGRQSRDGDLIVCLPNLMIVKIVAEDK